MLLRMKRSLPLAEIPKDLQSPNNTIHKVTHNYAHSRTHPHPHPHTHPHTPTHSHTQTHKHTPTPTHTYSLHSKHTQSVLHTVAHGHTAAAVSQQQVVRYVGESWKTRETGGKLDFIFTKDKTVKQKYFYLNLLRIK